MAEKEGVDGNDRNERLRLRDLPTPAFVINRHAFAVNCQQLLDLAKARGLHLRPHIKTHKTLEGLRIQATGLGESNDESPWVRGFVASTLPEVELLVKYYTCPQTTTNSDSNGSILYGVPMSETKLTVLWALQKRLINWNIQRRDLFPAPKTAANTTTKQPTRIILLMDHPEQIAMVQRFFQKQMDDNGSSSNYKNNNYQWDVFIKLDTGYHRAGATCDAQGVGLARAIIQSPVLKLKGVYSHCGHAYDENDPRRLQDITNQDMQQIQSFLQQLEEQECRQNKNDMDSNPLKQPSRSSVICDDFTISVGSTPSLLHHWNPSSENNKDSEESIPFPNKQWWNDFFQCHPQAILEIHPGNYTLYDRQQLHTRACPNVDAIAGRVLTRVIGHYNDEHRPNTILLDAGATALTKDTTPQGGMAAIAEHQDNANVYKMSQEVSMAQGTSSTFLSDCPLGSLLTLLPNHSCLAAACFQKFYIMDDPTGQFLPDALIVEEWEPVKGW